MVDRSVIRVKAMAYLPHAVGTHHAVLVASDPSSGRRFHRWPSMPSSRPEGGWYDDVGEPMWVEWRRCDEGDPDAPPVSGRRREAADARVESTGHSVVPDLSESDPLSSLTMRTPLS